jgi:acetyltransferase-like isoleucine patch superfamily enzyme
VIASGGRAVRAVHGRREIVDDPGYEIGLSDELRSAYGREQLIALFRRFSAGSDRVDTLMRRACLRALALTFGHGVTIEPNVGVKHPETFRIGSGVFIGEQAVLQGRFNGHFQIGDRTWIGPQAYFDARDLVIGSDVGWGPGAKVLGSEHTGSPIDAPIIATDLVIAPVRIEDWADVGVNAVILPGRTVGRGAMVGAGAVVTKDVPPLAKVAGVPAVIIGWRDGRSESSQDGLATRERRTE